MGDGEAAAEFRESLRKEIKRKQRWVGQSKRSGDSDGQTGVTSAASKRSVLSCRWSFMQQRSRKKRPIFYCPHGQYLGGIWFPSACPLPFVALTGLLMGKNQPSLTSSIFTGANSLSFFTSARISEGSSSGADLSSVVAPPHPRSSPPGAVKCLVALATTPGVPLTFAVPREACVESRPGGTVSARALCSRKIRANDGRCSFEARLTFEIAEKATFLLLSYIKVPCLKGPVTTWSSVVLKCCNFDGFRL